ncbi:MAG: poly(ribitol-phosphate) beta-N-acetylglucosaminyltransferase [Solirubrobacteraceae bacterium]|nr:poly(ribitol-phosphate) beta-N-acetylglucosaminyltransferase [Solirubrobacteraceae bacterium]
MIKVSVIVPVFNPGANIDRCIASLLDQSLAPGDYEVIFVDDGSTDATPARLDALAAEHPHVHVAHIPNSGWPGRPRNVGLDMARGDFVYFVDNDDWITRDALERMHTMAVQDEADIVIGKVVGHGKYVPAGLFRTNLHNVSLRDAPLVALLSPHKLFRRSFLEAVGLRFPEGRRRLEDHVFVMRAYFATDCTSVLADHPCYHWVRRGEANASADAWDPVMYYAAVREVLDIVDENTEPGPFRDELYLRWYRAKTLGRVGGSRSPLTKRDRAWQRTVFDEVRSIVLDRFDAVPDELLPFNERIRVALVRAGDFDAVLALARFEIELGTRARLERAGRDGDRTVMGLTLRLFAGRHTLRFRRDGERLLWVPPAGIASQVPATLLDATEDIDRSWGQVFVRSTASKTQYLIPSRNTTRLVDAGDGTVEVRVALEARLADVRAAAGRPLKPGDYDHPVFANIAGFTGDGVARRRRGLPPLATIVDAAGRPRLATTSPRAAALDLARRMPRVARAAKRVGGR